MNKHPRIKKILIVFILGFTLCNYHCGKTGTTQHNFTKAIRAFEEYVAEQMELQQIPGISVGFMKDDFVWTKGFGYADLENKSPARPESSYRLASITKTITAVAVLKLVEEGKIDLDAEVQTYVPYFPKKKWPVTVRQLLGHIGGISHYRNYAKEGHIKVHKNTRQAIAIFQDFDLVAEPGTKYNYSSYGFNLLGAVIEGASGKQYGEIIKEYVFDPLGMENSLIDSPVDLIPYRVRGYRIIDGNIKNSEYVDVSSRFAGGGTRSTVVDLLRYAKGILEGKILEKETWDAIFTPMKLQNQHFTGYGMGWRVSPLRGHFTVRHGGSQPETRTYLVILPKVRLAVALASNRERLNLSPFYLKLIELILDEDTDGSAYTPDWTKQTVYSTCAQTFSHGMGFYERYGKPLSTEKKDLSEAFDFFNTHVNEKSLKDNYKKEKEKIDDGIHPVSKQAFTKVGSYIAYSLENEYGSEALKNYYRKGPLSFFDDYATLSNKKPDYASYRIAENLKSLISEWEKDWIATNNDFVRHLTITANTDISEIGPKLEKTFSGAKIYPDFSSALYTTALGIIDKDKMDEALDFLTLSKELYPNSPLPYCGFGFAQVWRGNMEEARTSFHKAYELNPHHRIVSVNQFTRYSSRLARAKKLKEAIKLGNIALEIYPEEAQLYAVTGDRYSTAKQKEKAMEYYKKALQLDPEMERIKRKLRLLEKHK